MMKKSEIYKFALLAVIEKIARVPSPAQQSVDEIYELVSGLCEKIDIESLNERREAAVHE